MQPKLSAAALLAAFVASGLSAQTSLVTYSFTSGSTLATNVNSLLTASAFTSADSGATSSTSPVSSGYSGASGGHYFNDNNWTGTAPGTNYFTFSLTPTTGYSVTLDSLSFGYRGSSTASATTFTVRSSADGYAGNLVTGSLTADGGWYHTGSQSITLTFTDTTTLRIYANGASAGTATLRVDDVQFAGALSAIPEPSTYAAMAGAAALAAAAWRRRRPPAAQIPPPS
jgi:hypothetical protein